MEKKMQNTLIALGYIHVTGDLWKHNERLNFIQVDEHDTMKNLDYIIFQSGKIAKEEEIKKVLNINIRN